MSRIASVQRLVSAKLQSTPVQLPGRRVSVPTAARLRWQPNWKHDLFLELDVASHGVLDVGANAGQTLLDFLAAGGRNGYVGFEPLPEQASFVQHILEANPDVGGVVVPTALSDTHSIVPIHIPTGDSTSASLRQALRPGRELRRHLISVHPLDDIWSTVAPGSAITIVKVDVEGAELEVLTGMKRLIEEQRPTILCEVLDADTKAEMDEHEHRLARVEALVAALGYRIARVDKPRGRLEGCSELSGFPRRRWTAATAEECDYLLTPA